jgi:hypothetical protein
MTPVLPWRPVERACSPTPSPTRMVTLHLPRRNIATRALSLACARRVIGRSRGERSRVTTHSPATYPLAGYAPATSPTRGRGAADPCSSWPRRRSRSRSGPESRTSWSAIHPGRSFRAATRTGRRCSSGRSPGTLSTPPEARPPRNATAEARRATAPALSGAPAPARACGQGPAAAERPAAVPAALESLGAVGPRGDTTGRHHQRHDHEPGHGDHQQEHRGDDGSPPRGRSRRCSATPRCTQLRSQSRGPPYGGVAVTGVGSPSRSTSPRPISPGSRAPRG